MSEAPSEQLMLTASGRACSIESQKASTVCPERLRPLRRDLPGRCHGRLAVEAVEDGLDQEQVGATVAEAAGGLRVAGLQLVVRHRAVAGVVDAGRQRERDVRRTERAGHEAAGVAGGDTLC